MSRMPTSFLLDDETTRLLVALTVALRLTRSQVIRLLIVERAAVTLKN